VTNEGSKSAAYTFAIYRAYYALFYAVSALLLEEGRRFSKHSGVRAAFNRDLVKPGRLSRKHGELYNAGSQAPPEAEAAHGAGTVGGCLQANIRWAGSPASRPESPPAQNVGRKSKLGSPLLRA
jgi:HEPN domain-containing protein